MQNKRIFWILDQIFQRYDGKADQKRALPQSAKRLKMNFHAGQPNTSDKHTREYDQELELNSAV